MSELLAALRRLLRDPEPRTPAGLDDLDRDRAASMADEGGAAAARVDAPGSRPAGAPSRRGPSGGAAGSSRYSRSRRPGRSWPS